MVKAKGKTLTQHCIETNNFKKVMQLLPYDLVIESLTFEVGHGFGSKRISVVESDRDLGVTYIREPKQGKSVEGRFEDISRSKMIHNMETVCKKFGFDYDEARIRSILISKGEDSAMFHRTRKEIRPNERDLRRKLTVLGLTNFSGDMNSIISALSTKKYVCRIEIVPTRVITCAELK